MKHIATSILLLTAISGATAQNQANAYRSGTVVIQDDAQYGAGTDWKDVFSIPTVHDDGSAVEPRKSLAVADDGTAFVCNYDSYSVQKFDPSGRLVKTFGEQGPGDGQFRNRPTVHGILDNRYIFTSEHNGRLTFFDLNGQFVKVLELDYMPQQCLPLRDGKIAVVGFVVWSEARQRHIVAIEDMNGGEENIVCSKVTETKAYGAVTLNTNKGRVSFTGSSSRPGGWVVARTSNGDLIASFTDTPLVETFSPDGQRLGQFSMDIDRISYPEKERGLYGVTLQDLVAKLGVSEQELQKALDSVKHPEFLPYTYSLLVDNDGNLLAFVYTDNKDGHRFQAYRMSPAGQLIGKVDLLSESYELNLNPTASTIQFANGYVYAVVTPKGGVSSPARLVRGKLIAQ